MTEVETNGHERREDDPRCVKCGKAWPCEGWLLEPPRLQPAPIPASPARDVRIAAYRDRERRRAARALDRYFETLLGDTVGMGPAVSVAGERFVEDIGDYVAARLLGMLPDGMSVTYDRSPLQQKSVYGATAVCTNPEHSGGPHECTNGPWDGDTDNTPNAAATGCSCPPPYGKSTAPDPLCPIHRGDPTPSADPAVDRAPIKTLCTCDAMEGPHYFDRFTDCSGRLAGKRQCTDVAGPFFDEHPPGLCDRPSCCTPMSEVRKAQGRPPA